MYKTIKILALTAMLSVGSIISAQAANFEPLSFSSFVEDFPDDFAGGDSFTTDEFQPSNDTVTVRSLQKADSGAASITYSLVEVGTIKDYKVDSVKLTGNTSGKAIKDVLSNATSNNVYYIRAKNNTDSSVITIGSVGVYDN
ncbi:hypothetical protein HPY31_28525 [Brevibacillus sp. HB1.3]|uniref:hypothetical protein n=1 Tax=Brevibacillus sp. HB1.3 TaxID=2738842 RepID=UPI001552A89B|nr:hypothetical protein [Brevibacillus sp. HB1.3]NQF17814.1 hypothetical protein [Brevibacillus sp. HB1.3]